MKGERKLRLVPRLDRPLDRDDEPPFTDEERAAAEALREAIDHGAEPLAAELRAAHAPGTLGEADLDAIVERALGREAASTSAERAAAQQLAGGDPGSEHAALVEALKVAVRPTALDPARNEALIAAALRAPLRKSPLRRIAPATMAALTGVAALAASVALFFGRPPAPRPPAPTAELVRARSADDLFDATTPFPRHGEESARIDRIASARTADLRRNRFAAWGVK
jgi:hypothetical protein